MGKGARTCSESAPGGSEAIPPSAREGTGRDAAEEEDEKTRLV